jgi:excinuclease ABC subunit C
MREVLTRRYCQENRDKYNKNPDLIMVDGGKGQVNTALKVMEVLEKNIPVCGLVKDEHHRTRGIYYEGRKLV